MSCFSAMPTMSSFTSKDIISSAEVIVISSDEDSDGEVEAACENEKAIFKQRSSSYHCFKSSPSASPILIEDSDDEELPDLYLSHESEGKLSEDSDDEELPDLHISYKNEEKQVKENGENWHFSNHQKRKERVNASEPPVKVMKIDDKFTLQQEISFGIELPQLKRRISNSILRGEFKGQSLTPCNRSFTSCYENHMNQPKPTQTPVQSKVLFETMMDDTNLQHFALRAMSYRTVSHKQYIDPSLLNLLLQYLFGSELKYERPDAQGLHLGISILYKLLKFHPPCKEGMHHIYLKMCQDWFILLLKKVKVVLNDDSCVFEGVTIQEDIHQSENECVDTFSDYTSVIRRKAIEKREKYLKTTKIEKIHHLSILTKYFSKVMEHSFFQWSIRNWQRKSSALFRKDICPILSEIVWGSSTWNSDWGSVNATVQELFALYCGSTKERSLHESFGSVIAVCAAILHRKEMSSYPEMGQMTRAYAHKLYMEIKSSADKEVNLRNVHPDWLKFHIASSFLGVEEPANFFKAKERISKVLRDMDRNKDLYHSNISAETVCFETIKSMMGMIQLKSSVTEDCDLTGKILEDNNSWFSDILQDANISNQLKIIKHILCLPHIRNRNWFFDGFENCMDS